MLQPMRKTVADYFAYEGDERFELIDGEFVMSPAASFRHQLVHARLFESLRRQATALKLGEVLSAPFDSILSNENVVQPDILFLSPETLKRADPRLQGPPDVAIEIISKGHRARDTRKKKDLYFRFRVPEYWIVDPDKETITVLVWQDDGWSEHGVFERVETASSVVMKGVSIPVSGIFER